MKIAHLKSHCETYFWENWSNPIWTITRRKKEKYYNLLRRKYYNLHLTGKETEKWKLLSCVWLCDPMGYTVHEILQARILEWVAFPFSTGSSQLRDPTQVLRPKIPAFVPRRKNRATQWTSPADATRKRVYCRLRKLVTLISWEAEHIEQQIGQAFYRQKTIISAYYILVTKWLVTRLQSNPIGTNFAGYMFTKQSYWHKLRGLLFKFKAILLVQTAQAFVQT